MSKQQRESLDAMLRSAPQGFRPQPMEEMRSSFAAMMATMAVPTDVKKTPTTLGDRDAVLVEPEQNARPGTILYFHGGSFLLGSPETAMGLTANLVTRTGYRAISLDYRLAPEHPFPAAIEDALSAYRALLESGIEASSIVFAGDSAGGGLSVTTCLAARSAGLPMPAAVLTFSAGLDHTRSGASVETKADVDPFFTKEGLMYNGSLYMAGQDPHQELLSPVTLADLTGFPPVLMQVGGNEMMLDDSTRFAERARDAGVDVILDFTAGVPHVFQSFVGVLDESDQALDRAALFLKQRLG
ncbi:alpha/beta hydrolase [Psychromicrobium sp. YIM B11713]|uniref:alpha/beta hydrolase n=1 Tax=Psychromicrobium sp. YIM B11713 TaxID=3145233 RepID=UPI00374F4A08